MRCAPSHWLMARAERARHCGRRSLRATSPWSIGRPSPVGLLGLLTVPVLALIATLMNATGIELDARRDLDLDRELRSAASPI